MLAKVRFFFILTVLSSEIVTATSSEIVCYHGTWAKYRVGNGAFTVSNIDHTLCTYLIYSFVGLGTDSTVVSLDTYLDNDLGTVDSFTALKSSNSNLKVLVAIGGWNEGSVTYSNMAASSTLRAAFIESALSYCQTYNFDGFDIDWEYPADRGGSTADKENFVTLLQELSTVFKANNLVVTAAVRAAADGVETSYDVPGISQYLDLINVMTYDLHGSSDGVTGHNAPLYASSIDTTASALQLNVDAAISNWIAQGADASKIVLGIPLYGRSFTLSDSSDVALGAASSGAGTAGPYTQEAGFLGYNEIVEKQLEGNWTVVWDDEQQVPHMYKDDQWVGYDNPTSVALKTQYAISKGLAGVMVWSIETDDFLGLSGVTNPLLTAINEAMASYSTNSTTSAAANSSESSTAAATTTTAAATTTTTTAAATTTTAAATITTAAATTTTAAAAATAALLSSTELVCTETGYFRNPNDCSKYYYCSEANATPAELSCPTGLYYDTTSAACDWSDLVTC